MHLLRVDHRSLAKGMNLHAFTQPEPELRSPWSFPLRLTLGLLALWKLADVAGWVLWGRKFY